MILKIIRATCFYTNLITSLSFTNLLIRWNEIYYRNLSENEKLKINRNTYVSTISFFFKFLFWIKIKLYSKEIDLKKNNYVMVANHTSYFDMFVLTKLFHKNVKNYHNCRIIGMERLFSYPIIGYVLKKIKMIPIKFKPTRDDEKNKYDEASVQKLVNTVNDSLKKKKSIVLFPEGRLNDNPKIMNEIRNGAYNFSKNNDVPIKIIAIKGVDKVWKRNCHPTGYGTISVKIFDPNYNFDNIENYRKTIRTTIENYLKN